MAIEDNMLLIILVGLSLAIAIVVVIIRFAVKKEPSAAAGSLLSVLGRGRNQPAAEDAAETGAGIEQGDSSGNNDLSLPSIDDLDSLSFEPEKSPAQESRKPKEKASGAGIITVITDLLRGIFGRRKVREEIKHDVKEIDDQLNQVLQESHNLGLDIQNDVRIPNISTLSESKSLRDIDKGMRDQQPAQEKKSAAPSQPQSLEGMNPYAQGGGFDFNLPDVPSLQQEASRPQAPEQKKPDLSQQPRTPQVESKAPENTFKGQGPMDATQDLLSEIAAESVKEVVIDVSIMKDLAGVPIPCDELEKDLTSILGQISVNAKASGKKKRA